MNILTKHLLAKITYYTLISSFIFIGLIFALQSTKLLKLFVDSSAGIISFIYLVLVSLPSLLQEIVPLIILLTTILMINSLKNNNEITIMRAVGLNEFKIYKPIFVMMIFMSLVNFFITNNLIPNYEKKYLIAKHNLSANIIDFLISQQKQNKIIPIGDKELLYIEDINNNGTISNMILYAPDKDEGVLIYSESGKISKDINSTPILFLENATFITLSENSYSKLILKEYIVYLQDLFDLQNNVSINYMSRKNMTLIELLGPLSYIQNKLNKLIKQGLVQKDNKITKQDIKTYNTEGYRRLLNIINCFTFTIIALFFMAGNSSERKTNNLLTLKIILSSLALRIIQLTFVFNSNGNVYTLSSIVVCSIVLFILLFDKFLKHSKPVN